MAELWQAKHSQNREMSKRGSNSPAYSSALERRFKSLLSAFFRHESLYTTKSKELSQLVAFGQEHWPNMAKIDLWAGGIFGGPCTLHPMDYPRNVVLLYIRPHLPSTSNTQIHRSP